MAFPYSRSQADWQNDAAGGTPITEAVMDNIEAGIKSLSDIFALAAAKGDILVATSNDTWAVKTVGTDAKALVADSSQSDGLIYKLLVNANIDPAAAIAYSKLNLASSIVSADIVDGTIVNGDINASAGITVSKMADLIAPAVVASWHTATGNTTGSANRAFLCPIGPILVPTSLTKISFNCVASASNWDVGIYYTDDESTFTKLFSTGSFAALGTGVQTKSFGAQVLTPVAGRRWYLAIATDSVTNTFRGTDPNSGLKWYAKATSFALPSSLTGMTTAATVADAPVLHGYAT